MTKYFLDKYFSYAKIKKFIREIHNFFQNDTENSFRGMKKIQGDSKKIQHNKIELWMQLQDF